MQFYDIIAKKRDGDALTNEEIEQFVQDAAQGSVPDYQLSALLMAIYLRGMTDGETARLTQALARSGDTVDLSSIPGVKVDKHSTGGVGDKTTLIVAPLVAACDVPVAKMSGRGLGHTGGTIDKLESIPSFQTELEGQAFLRQVREIGLALAGQSGNLAPADKKLYALRDVTATVGSLPLIASSIMSKKLAAGSDAILLDVKTGSGALLPSFEDALALAGQMVAIGRANGKQTSALITGMDTPLGRAIGNSLEVAEAVEVLRGGGPEDLRTVCLALAADMLQLAGKGDPGACLSLAETALSDGRALAKLRAVVAAQNGDVRYIDEPSRFPAAPHKEVLYAEQEGYITRMQAQEIGAASVLLGAGRRRKEDSVDPAAGLLLHKKTGDYVRKGDALATLHCQARAMAAEAADRMRAAVCYSDTKPAPTPLIYARVNKDGTLSYLKET
ncbi:thymidine phosphorylase [Ruminococcaceae bacterium OttesenSCG-928-I18]|nr:thymidine phosphorylase [Ruminococcaceae bacterium OttesenSCG-928-I18]